MSTETLEVWKWDWICWTLWHVSNQRHHCSQEEQRSSTHKGKHLNIISYKILFYTFPGLHLRGGGQRRAFTTICLPSWNLYQLGLLPPKNFQYSIFSPYPSVKFLPIIRISTCTQTSRLTFLQSSLSLPEMLWGRHSNWCTLWVASWPDRVGENDGSNMHHTPRLHTSDNGAA